jgi:tellurite resistance protein
MNTYTEKVDWQYFQDRYAGVPADAIIDQRIKMAARYAALEGGLSAGAYTATVAATIGSLGGASPATVPAAVATMMVDVAFVTQLQLRLAYDISVLYRVPLDVHDPEDLWKLIRVAFTIKSGEAANKTVIKAVPVMVRPLVKRFYSKSVLAAGRALPVVGKHLLQRNVIKIGIPLVGVPLAVVMNRYTTLLAGRHARAVFRNEARVIELAERLSKESQHPQLMLWVAWLVIMADSKIADDEALLMRHLVRVVREQHQAVDEELAHLVDIDPAEVWKRVDAEPGDLSYLVDVADRVAAVDGDVNAKEKAVISDLRERCQRV